MTVDWVHFSPFSALAGRSDDRRRRGAADPRRGPHHGRRGDSRRRARRARRRRGLALVADRWAGVGAEPRARLLGRRGADLRGGLARPCSSPGCSSDSARGWARAAPAAMAFAACRGCRRARSSRRRCSWPRASRPSSSFATSWPEKWSSRDAQRTCPGRRPALRSRALPFRHERAVQGPRLPRSRRRLGSLARLRHGRGDRGRGARLRAGAPSPRRLVRAATSSCRRRARSTRRSCSAR